MITEETDNNQGIYKLAIIEVFWTAAINLRHRALMFRSLWLNNLCEHCKMYQVIKYNFEGF